MPEVQISAAGRPDALAMPRAAKPAERSSSTTRQGGPQEAAASARGVEREPGEITAPAAGWVRRAAASASAAA